jgi:hypothetical protein
MSLTLALAFSHHINMQGDYNEVHPSIRYTQDHFIAGAYLNSEGNVSPYVGGRWEFGQFYFEAGAVFGYEYANVAPYARAGYDVTDNLGVFVAPAYEIWNGEGALGMVAGVEFTFR